MHYAAIEWLKLNKYFWFLNKLEEEKLFGWGKENKVGKLLICWETLNNALKIRKLVFLFGKKIVLEKFFHSFWLDWAELSKKVLESHFSYF